MDAAPTPVRMPDRAKLAGAEKHMTPSSDKPRRCVESSGGSDGKRDRRRAVPVCKVHSQRAGALAEVPLSRSRTRSVRVAPGDVGSRDGCDDVGRRVLQGQAPPLVVPRAASGSKFDVHLEIRAAAKDVGLLQWRYKATFSREHRAELGSRHADLDGLHRLQGTCNPFGVAWGRSHRRRCGSWVRLGMQAGDGSTSGDGTGDQQAVLEKVHGSPRKVSRPMRALARS